MTMKCSAIWLKTPELRFNVTFIFVKMNMFQNPVPNCFLTMGIMACTCTIQKVINACCCCAGTFHKLCRCCCRQSRRCYKYFQRLLRASNVSSSDMPLLNEETDIRSCNVYEARMCDESAITKSDSGLQEYSDSSI